MQSFRLDIFGEPQVARMVLSPAENARDFSRSWDLILDELEAGAARQFATEGREYGTPWPALARSTEERKRPGRPMLVDTGALLASLTGGPGNVRHVSSDYAEWGTDVPYAVFHQGGTRNMPARPLVALDEGRRRRVVEVLMEGLFRDVHGFVRGSSGRFAALGF